MAPSAIPDRWIPYKSLGSVIEGTRFICFKVPLRKKVQIEHLNRGSIKEIWDLDTLLDKLPKLGLVIDLTNTSRYYDPAKLTSSGVMYHKILLPGRIIPPEKNVKEFFDRVDDFLRVDKDKLIGIHCTHGLNRTGYMVCRYMRDRMRLAPAVAIQRFEAARGYHIERDNYIADLIRKQPPSQNLIRDAKLNALDSEVTGNPVNTKVKNTNDPRKKEKERNMEQDWRKRERMSPVKFQIRRSHESNISRKGHLRTSPVRANWREQSTSSMRKPNNFGDGWRSNRRPRNNYNNNTNANANSHEDRPYDHRYDY